MQNAGAFAVIAVFAAIVLSQLSYIPIWDGQGYAMCIMDFPLFPLSVENARCFGHPSIAYVWYQRLFQLLSPGSVPLLFVANLVLVGLTALSFNRLLRFLFPHQSLLEQAASIALLIFTPVLTIHVFHITPDLGTVCFFTIYLSLLLRKKYRLAALAGTALCFSKEVGAGVYVASLIALPVLIAPYVREARGLRQYARIIRTFLPLLLPVIVIGVYFMTRHSLEGANGAMWNEFSYSRSDTWRLLLSSDISDPSFATFLFDIFALNFQWILTGVIAIASMRFMLRAAAGIFPQVSSEQVSRFLFLILMMIATVYITTRLRPWNNARYTLLCLPIFILLFQYALTSLAMKKNIREGFLSILTMLFLLSNFFTFDPLSRAYFSVFEVNGRQMLNMNSTLNTGYALGRDEMAYNLEFVSVTDSLRKIVEEVKPTPDTIFFTGIGLGFQLPFVRSEDKKFTLNRSDSFSLRTIEDAAVTGDTNFLKDQQKVYYVEFPNLNNTPMRIALNENGTITKVASKSWDEHGVHLYLFEPHSPETALHAAADNLD